MAEKRAGAGCELEPAPMACAGWFWAAALWALRAVFMKSGGGQPKPRHQARNRPTFSLVHWVNLSNLRNPAPSLDDPSLNALNHCQQP
jgi:hypothetical protein